jgi:hypothetical protein
LGLGFWVAAGVQGHWPCTPAVRVSNFPFIFFALVERKKDKHMIEEYHAAAGKNASL